MKRLVYCLIVSLIGISSIFGMSLPIVEVKLKDGVTHQVHEDTSAKLLNVMDKSVSSTLQEGGVLPLLEMSLQAFVWLVDNLDRLNDKDKLIEPLDELFRRDFDTYCNLLIAAHRLLIGTVSKAGYEHSNQKLFEAIGAPERLKYLLKDFSCLSSKYSGVIGINSLNTERLAVSSIYPKQTRPACVRIIKRGSYSPQAKDGWMIVVRESATVLSVASVAGDVAMVQFLIDAGADLDKKVGFDKRTALHVAAMHDRKDVMKLLIDAGADKGMQDMNGNTPLITTSMLGEVDSAKLLINAGVQLDLKNDSGDSALSRAASEGNTKIAGFLIDARADINTVDSLGYTPLMIANVYIPLRAGHIAVIKLLINAGAELNHRAMKEYYQGKTALGIALDKGNEEIIQLLREAGAEE